MDRGDWAFTIASVVIGVLLVLVVEWLRGQLERGQRKRDRRDNFQHRSLLELQDALGVLAVVVGDIYMDRGVGKEPTDRSQRDLLRAEAPVLLLNERILDQQVRQAVSEYCLTARGTLAERTQIDPAVTSIENVITFQAVNKRIGELLRTL